MSPRRILFIGLGGAGQRHLRIFRDLLPDAELLAYRRLGATPLLNADFSVRQGDTLEAHYGVTLIRDLDEAFAARPDLAVISTPTSLHRDAMFAAIGAGAGVVVEKPWAESTARFSEFESAVRHSRLPFWIGFQRRHHPYIRRIRDLIAGGKLGKIINAEFVVGSFVPAWHGYEDWRTLYAVRPELGGGVVLTEIHEIDLCCWYFGLPQSVYCAGGNYGPEPLAVEDTAQITCNYESFSAQISLCFMEQMARRRIEIVGTAGRIVWDAEGNRFVHDDYGSGSRIDEAMPEFSNDAMFQLQAGAIVSQFESCPVEEQLRAAWASQVVAECAKASMVRGAVVGMPAYPQSVTV